MQGVLIEYDIRRPWEGPTGSRMISRVLPMTKCLGSMSTFMILCISLGEAREKTIVSLKNFCDIELKSEGMEVPKSTMFHIKALGGGGDHGWTYKSKEMFAYGWIINADTRK